MNRPLSSPAAHFLQPLDFILLGNSFSVETIGGFSGSPSAGRRRTHQFSFPFNAVAALFPYALLVRLVPHEHSSCWLRLQSDRFGSERPAIRFDRTMRSKT